MLKICYCPLCIRYRVINFAENQSYASCTKCGHHLNPVAMYEYSFESWLFDTYKCGPQDLQHEDYNKMYEKYIDSMMQIKK